MIRSNEPLGLVAFSFALHEEEPSICNQKLAQAVSEIVHSEPSPIKIAAQWEVAAGLSKLGICVDHEIHPVDNNTYLDSRGVWESAQDYFVQHSINNIIPVAQPYFQLPYVKRMMHKAGFNVVNRHIGQIGFDNSESNLQPWTKSRAAFTRHILEIVILGKQHGQK